MSSINTPHSPPTGGAYIKEQYSAPDWDNRRTPDLRDEATNSKRRTVTFGLGGLLADTYLLYLKTQNFHWNVSGPNFLSFHQMFGVQYTDLFVAIDLIAERIRALGEPAPGTFSEFSKLGSLQEDMGTQTPQQMVATLKADNQTLVQTLRGLIPNSEQIRDYATVDLLTQRLQAHEKNVWILSSLLK